MSERPESTTGVLPDWLVDLATRIDAAADDRNASELDSLSAKAESLAVQNLEHGPELLYFAANAQSVLDNIGIKTVQQAWEWERPAATKEILLLRAAKASTGFDTLHVVRRCQVWTNLGNALSKVGRPIEAIESWDQAITQVPSFAMALGNRADGLMHFANALHDPGQQGCIWTEAKASFDRSLDKDALWDSGFQSDAYSAFSQRRDYLAKITKPEWAVSNLDQSENDLGVGYEEKQYRRWRLANRLFLNPLNDLGAWFVAARDIYHLPNHTYDLAELPRFVRYYDLMKQEFVAACALFYEGMPVDLDEYADREVLLYEHADYEISGIRLEKQKAAYRLSYSVLDKIAGFLNEYFKLERDDRSISFRNVWYNQPKGMPRTLDPRLIEHHNWPLRGLHAVSKDFFDRSFQEVAEPDAKQLSDLRNAMEHRFLSVHDFGSGSVMGQAHSTVTYSDFSSRAVRLLKLVRSALTYLSMAVHTEERRRSVSRGADAIVVPTSSTTRR